MNINISNSKLIPYEDIQVNRRIRKITVKDIVFLMLSLTILIDFLNGILAGMHLGEAFRIILLLVCSCYILKYGRKEKSTYLTVAFFLIFNVFFSSIVFGDGLMTNIRMALKYSIFFAVFLTLMSMHRRCIIGIADIDKVIRVNIYYAPALFIFSYILEIGQSSYNFADQNLGFKSGFLSLNSVNIALIALYIFCINKLFNSDEKKWFLLSLYVAVPMAMLGTKTGYAIIVAVPVLFLLLGIKKKRTWRILMLATIGSLILAKPFRSRVLPLFQGIIARQKLLYSQRSLWTYLTSTRNIRVSNVLGYYFTRSNPLTIFFGSGYYWIHNIAARLEMTTSSVIPLEMDWADLLVTYGLIGFIFTYYFVLKRIIKAGNIRKIAGGTAYFWTSVILLLYGTFAGHLFFEAISSTFYGIALAGMCIASSQEKMSPPNNNLLFK